MIGKARIDNLLHDLAKLIHFDWKDSPVLVLVAALGDRTGKGFIQSTNPVPKQVMGTYQERKP